MYTYEASVIEELEQSGHLINCQDFFNEDVEMPRHSYCNEEIILNDLRDYPYCTNHGGRFFPVRFVYGGEYGTDIIGALEPRYLLEHNILENTHHTLDWQDLEHWKGLEVWGDAP